MTLPSFKDYLQLHFIVFIWGFTAILGRIVSIPYVELVFYRTLFAVIGLWAIFYFQKKSFKVDKKDLWKFLATGGIIALHWIFFFGAAQLSNVSICLIGMATSSFWTSLLDPIISRRRISWLEIILGVVIVAGLYFVSATEISYTKGLLLAIIATIFGTIFSIINSKLIKKHNHYTITFYEMLGALLAVIIFLPIYQYFFAPNQTLNFALKGFDWLYIAILAFVCTVYAYAMSVKLMKKFSVFAINLTVNLEPVYGFGLAYFILGEREKLPVYLAGVTILLAVFAYTILDWYFKLKTQKNRLEILEELREEEKVRYEVQSTNYEIKSITQNIDN